MLNLLKSKVKFNASNCGITKRAHDVKMTSDRRRCDVTTSCACWAMCRIGVKYQYTTCNRAVCAYAQVSRKRLRCALIRACALIRIRSTNVYLIHKRLIVLLTRYVSCLMGKPTICIGDNKDADQLRGNREADQRLCFRYSDSTIPLLLKSEISSL